MLRGQLWATSDIELVHQALHQGIKVVYLGDSVSMDPNYSDVFTMATSLVPDYETMSLLVDGNEAGFVQMYMASLNSKAAMEMISAIIMALYKGINVMFYLPKEAAGLNFVQYLLSYLKFNYGIETQTKTTQFSFDPHFSGKIIELLYLNNLIPAQEFLINSESLDDLSLRKLVSEIHPMVQDPTNIEQIIQWFSNYKENLLSSNIPLINGVQYAGEDSDYACY